MATSEELKQQLKKAKQELREAREEVKESKIREKLYLERLDNWAEKNQSLNNKISNMTIDDVVSMQKAKAEYEEKYKKDMEVIEAFDKQAQVKLNTDGIDNGDTIRENQQT
mgnify:FL=1|jgi:type I site-specific restriction endonuclease|tara:strand:- start:145 stop:477 length:333 start_codon:yes stop_codon:yes gene_type:complete